MKVLDAELAAAIAGEASRQETHVELIASENYVSPNVLAVQGSCLTNKYADGYPGARTYSGCEFVDIAESLACKRACRLFGAAHANVQPYSGTQANAAALLALLEPGDTLLGMASAHGGHITHGHAKSFAGQFYRAVHYETDAATGLVDYESIADAARTHRPKAIIAGYSAYSRGLDWARFRAIADEVGAWLIADMAHVAGLVAAGLCDSPVPHAHVCTSTTHKTLRGPRGGLILTCDPALGERIDAAVYPGIQGGPLMHVVAAKAAAFEEAATPQFVDYQRAVLDNARTLAAGIAARGFAILTGGTDNHMMLVDLSTSALDAPRAAAALESAHIATSVWRLPQDDPSGPPRGLRLGTPAVTTRGFAASEMELLAELIGDVLDDKAGATKRASAEVEQLCRLFPVYGPGSAWEH